MTSSSYDAALARVLAHEGGYTNHPADPGGPTNFGITIADYRRYVKPGATAADVRAMRLDEAKAIYRAQYWDALRCDELPAGLDYALFDYAVNSGVGRAIKVLQRLLGLADDGRMNDAAIAAARQRDAAELVGRLCDERLAFLKRLKTWPVFGAGWGRRVAEVRTGAMAMAKAPPPAVAHGDAAGGKRAVPVNARAWSGIGAAIAAAGAAIGQWTLQAGARPIVLVGIAVALGCAVAGWLVWRSRRRQQASN